MVETDQFSLCWVKNSAGEIEQRVLSLGDSDDVFIIVKSGLIQGDEVLLNPLGFLEDAQLEALRASEPVDRADENPKSKAVDEKKSLGVGGGRGDF